MVSFLSDAEATALLASPDRSTTARRRDYPLILLAQTGLRVSELTGLRCGDVTLGVGARAYPRQGPQGTMRPLTPQAAAAVRKWMRERAGQPADPLFPAATTGRSVPARPCEPAAPFLAGDILAPHSRIGREGDRKWHAIEERAASRMSVGIGLPQSPPLGLNRALVSLARLSRLDTVWVNDHWQGEMPSALWDQQFSWAAASGESPHASFDHKVLLGYLAKSAGRLRVGVGVTDPVRHHPVALAQAFLTLARMTRRRPILGIGGGERENIEPYGLDFSAPAGRLEEALQIIRLCFSHQGPIDFHGKHYHLERAVMEVRAPEGKAPEIWVGGQGPRMLRLAGHYGDGWRRRRNTALPGLLRRPLLARIHLRPYHAGLFQPDLLHTSCPAVPTTTTTRSHPCKGITSQISINGRVAWRSRAASPSSHHRQTDKYTRFKPVPGPRTVPPGLLRKVEAR